MKRLLILALGLCVTSFGAYAEEGPAAPIDKSIVKSDENVQPKAKDQSEGIQLAEWTTYLTLCIRNCYNRWVISCKDAPAFPGGCNRAYEQCVQTARDLKGCNN